MPHHQPPAQRLMILGDHDTAGQTDQLAEAASARGAAILEVHAFERGAAWAAQDLTQVDEVVLTLARAIAERAWVWVPYPLQDLGREQHSRRLSLALQRHGLNLMVGPVLTPCPVEGGLDASDYALRDEVRSVDALDRAALAAAAVTTLAAEIEDELRIREPSEDSHVGEAARHEDTMRRLVLLVLEHLECRCGPAPALPPPNAPWAERQPRLRAYATWLVATCKVKQVTVARALNALGQRTKQGREWQRATVSALVNGRYDGGAAA